MAKRRMAETTAPVCGERVMTKLVESLRDKSVPPTVAEELVETLNGSNLDAESRSRVLQILQLLLYNLKD